MLAEAASDCKLGHLERCDRQSNTPGTEWRVYGISPVLGELAMLGFRDPARNAIALMEAGMPKEMARHEGTQIDRTMRQCILKLIRSSRGLRIKGAWEDDLVNLPKSGMLVWGETDPYFSLEVPQRFL